MAHIVLHPERRSYPSGRKAGARLMGTVLASSCLLMSPAWAQMRDHGAGVNWSGSHGGVNWDGGHRYEGGDYGGYPGTAPPPAYLPRRPAYNIPPPLYRPAYPLTTTREERRTDRIYTPNAAGRPPR